MDILSGLMSTLEKEKASFHMPGHKNGAAFFGTPLYNDIMKLDTTELCGTDCLAEPTDFLKQAQERAAKAYGADEAFFLVNGSTGGILSMFYSAFSDGDMVLVDRNCHKSAISAMAITGVKPIYISPEKNEELMCLGKLSPEKIEEQLIRHPEIKGVYITSPNYYGICSDVKKIAEIAHKNGAYLLVDEAHGAHFPFSSRFPQNASRAGADLSVASLHKSLAAPNQTAILCKKGSKADSNRLKEAVNTFQTTSPSYILMTYADFAVSMAKQRGEELTERLLLLQKGVKARGTDDPFKLIISYKEKGISGEELEEIFREKFGIFAELSDHTNVLLMSSWGNSEEEFELLKKACSYVESLPDKPPVKSNFPEIEETAVGMRPKDVLKARSAYIPLQEACGKVCAESVMTFPPCIPVILPGEEIKTAQINFLMSFKGKITGTSNGLIKVLRD